jgi:hypothetical protein
MKHMKLIVLISLAIATGCSKSPETPDFEIKTGYVFKPIKQDPNDEKFPLYRVSQNKVPSQHDFEVEREAIEKLNDLGSITSLARTSRPNAHDQKSALKNYKIFIREHRQDSVLVRHFRDKYAKSLLLEHGILETSDSEDLSFLIEELVLAKTGRFNIILTGLEKMSLQGDRQTYYRLLGEARRQIELGLENFRIAQQRLQDLRKKLEDGKVQNEGTLRKDFMIATLEQDDFTESIQKLEKYHQRLLAL